MLILLYVVAGLLVLCMVWGTAYSTGKAQGEMTGMGHTGHARMVHMTDMSNLHSLFLRADIRPAVDYAHAALRAVETDPCVDQKMPERI
jgi:hypothetical protein